LISLFSMSEAELIYKSINYLIMEAAGIEPASANPLLSGLHAYPVI